MIFDEYCCFAVMPLVNNDCLAKPAGADVVNGINKALPTVNSYDYAFEMIDSCITWGLLDALLLMI